MYRGRLTLMWLQTLAPQVRLFPTWTLPFHPFPSLSTSSACRRNINKKSYNLSILRFQGQFLAAYPIAASVRDLAESTKLWFSHRHGRAWLSSQRHRHSIPRSPGRGLHSEVEELLGCSQRCTRRDQTSLHLTEEIETLSLVLSEFESSEQAGLDIRQDSTSRCLKFCQRAANILYGVVQDTEAEIKKRRSVGSVKAVLRKDAIQKIRERLMTAQSMLMLSNQVYLV